MKLYKQEARKMQTKDLRTFVESELVEEVVIQHIGGDQQWVIAVIGERIPSRFRELIETARGEVRWFKDLGTAYGVVRASGWNESIRIEG
jgi:hypothetical protein